MKFVGVIPSRFGSTRFPGKPLADLNGRPLIQWVVEGVCQSQILESIIVATDDERIASTVVSFARGMKKSISVVMTSSEIPSGTDRVYAATQDLDCEVVVNIQGDEPLIEGSLIDSLAGLFIKNYQIDMATLAHPISYEELHSQHSVKVLLNQQQDAIYFSRFPIPYSRSGAKKEGSIEGCMKHIGMYAYRKDFLKRFCTTSPALIESAESLEQLRALYLGARIRVLPVTMATPGVDTPEDLERVKTILRKKYGK